MIAAVVLTFDAPPGMLEDCLASVLAAGGVRVIVVDNGQSAAGCLAAVPALAGCELITTGRNRGYAGGMNVGIERALALGADAVVLLNDDLTVEPGWLAPLLAELDHDDRVGAVQPKLLLAGTDPLLVNSLGVELGADGAGVDIGIGRPDTADDVATDIDVFTGGAVLLRAAFIRSVGMFDERYFLYYEDVDLALRGRRGGWRYRCAPASRVHHRGGVSASKVGDRTAFWRERNRLWILFRHRPFGHVLRGLWLSVRRVRWAPRAVHARALVAGLAAAPRLLVARFRSR